MRVFIDTSAWVGLLNAGDQHHADARKIWKKILDDRMDIYTSDYVVDETLTLLRRRAGTELAAKFAGKLKNGFFMNLVFVSEDDFWKARDMFIKFADRDFSFTDCVSFVLMEKYKVRKSFAYDRHFQAMNFEPLSCHQ